MIVVQACSAGTPDGNRMNEDTYFYTDNGQTFFAAVFDGVTDRLIPQRLKPFFKGLTGSAYAAQNARTIMTSFFNIGEDAVGGMLKGVNTLFQRDLQDAYGTLDPAEIVHRESALLPFRDDPRYIRLILPACVATAIRIQKDKLTYAHVGDTELIAFYEDGRTERVIVPHRPNWRQAVPPVAANSEPLIKKYRQSGLFHNYVDQQGRTDPTVGIGVVNGLPEMQDYLIAGELDLRAVSSVLLCSDGFLWPIEAESDPSQWQFRLNTMRHLIEAEGVSGTLRHLRDEERTDAECVRYPRPKKHDDATAIWIRFVS